MCIAHANGLTFRTKVTLNHGSFNKISVLIIIYTIEAINAQLSLLHSQLILVVSYFLHTIYFLFYMKPIKSSPPPLIL